MPKGKALAPAVVGVAGGLVAGYFIGNMTAPVLPRIEANPPSPLANTAYQLIFWNFPPNTQLVSARNSTVPGGDVVNVGTTDGAGKLVVNTTSTTTAGTYYIYAFDALTGKYCAVYTLVVR